MKDLWIQKYEELRDELHREPYDEEIKSAVVDYIAALQDRLKDERKYAAQDNRTRDFGTYRHER